MSTETLDTLLKKLNGGDAAAAQEAFIAYEPYLRKVVRRLLPLKLRPKFDSIDVVQSVYADVLTAFRDGGMRFGTAAQLRAFLTKATRNRFIDRFRQHQRDARAERPLFDTPAESMPHSPQPRPSENAQAGETWDRLLALCPPQHAELLRLRRQGASAGEIAARTGMHEGSVRRILRELSIRLACSSAAPAESARP